jgi:CheY-like chemotaxis protein
MQAKVLIIEDEIEIRDMIQLQLESDFSVEALLASSGNEAIEIIKANPDLKVIISDINMPKGNGYDVFAAAQKLVPKAFFIFCTAYSQETVAGKLGPDAGKVKVVTKPGFLGPLQALLEGVLKGDARSEKEVFCPVNVGLLQRIGIVPYELYVKLNDEKFVKVSLSGEQFTSEDASRFLHKKVAQLYLTRSDSTHLLNDLARMLTIMKADNAGIEGILEAQAGALESVREFTEAFGVSEATTKVIAACVELTGKFLEKHAGTFPVFSKLLSISGCYFSTRSIMLSYVTGVLAQQMKWDSNLTYLKLCYASVLVDISLTSKELERLKEFEERAAKVEDPDLVFDPELKHFMEHPQRSAAILAQMSDVPLETDVLVLQHHEEPDGSGYPNRMHLSRIGPLSAILIFSMDLVDYLLVQGKGREQLSLIREFCHLKSEKYNSGVFGKIHRQVLETVGTA